jgi:hypothetical protein
MNGGKKKINAMKTVCFSKKKRPWGRKVPRRMDDWLFDEACDDHFSTDDGDDRKFAMYGLYFHGYCRDTGREVTVVRRACVCGFPVSYLLGLGPLYSTRLGNYGIRTIHDLVSLTIDKAIEMRIHRQISIGTLRRFINLARTTAEQCGHDK